VQITELVARGGAVEVDSWEPEPQALEFEGRSMEEIQYWNQGSAAKALVEVVEMAPGAELPLHGGEHLAICNVHTGGGTVSLPDGEEIAFTAPHLFVFGKDTRHGWCKFTEPTLMTVCLVDAV
jgi:quercetin dioxygenase-like cupin family protein